MSPGSLERSAEDVVGGAWPLRLWAVEGGGSSFQAVERATKWRLLRGVNWID